MIFEHLRTPFSIRGLSFRNRIFSSGHQTLLAKSGLPTEALAAYHEARARGGVGLIVTEATTVHETAFFSAATPTGHRDECIPGFRDIAEAVHRHACRVIGQLFHPGAEVVGVLEDGSRPVPWAPSAHHQERYLVTARPMPVALIEEVIDGYGDTAGRLIEAGYDGVEVLASHGYLPGQFLNPRLNRRDDEYGGTLENRMRFLAALYDNVRLKVGDDKIVGLRISADEKTHIGLAEEESLQVIDALDKQDRFDYFSVTLGSSSTTQGATHLVPPMAVETAYVAPYAGRLKQRTTRAVFVVGRINQPQDAEKILAAGQADMVGMTRAQICDPEVGNKIEAGRVDEIRACIGCNQACIGHYAVEAPISCIQHPETGRELEYGKRVAAARPRRVLVVGGGPGGMKAAAVAAERGHEVLLCEKQKQLGGQALLAQALPGREEFGGIITNLEREMTRAGVDVRTGVEVTSAMVRAEAPEVVIIATGATPYIPDMVDSASAHIVDAWQVIRNEVDCGDRVVIADWRGDWIGLGVADKLVHDGHHVRLLTVANAAGVNVQYYVRDPWIGELSRLGVEFKHYARLYGADEDTVYFQHATTGEPIECTGTDTLVVCYGHQSVMDLADALAGWDGEVHSIGDALSPRTAEEAVLDGLKVASAI
jgi:2,4-dienoyl-CoA reductase-like NADH-dependent reductase (Old Yellow Enzyme family)